MNNSPQDKNNFFMALTQLNLEFTDFNPVTCPQTQTIINTIRDSVILLDKDYKILMVNQTTLNLLDYSEQELVNRSIFDILNEKDFHLSLVENSINRIIETTYLKKNNQKVPMFLSNQPILSNQQDIMAIICTAKDISEVKKIEQLIKDNEAKLYHEFCNDHLTGLPNRQIFIEELEKSLQKTHEDTSSSFSVLLIDLDSLEIVNNIYGSLVADNLLTKISDRLKKYLNSQDTLARLGGNKFGVILNHSSNSEGSLEVVKVIEESFSRPFQLNDYEVYISVTMGMTTSKENYQKVEDIVRDADAALNYFPLPKLSINN
ncbi:MULTISPECIES: GGDEF domain-containing protein [Crocosphaera]|uniref:PAS:GGDEF n=5 Tax=Crocosphaera watsonii TaxID=263511 RepID=Q4C4B8_CROWT|nr:MULTISPECIES: GGDEF domain-containing protein [Crocosphaera]EAM50996.1 PAS:GGDEF [Crocosphaera watsonii WH 8501]EHJ12943.1 diguanylate cyclase/phosphodiesterase with GAF domain [Crocosphaera watsonii WH 0003]MCH2247337.1 GGDEF domain-containing protein [Crocosphaera sp.]NQZ61476.1 sensor domain-containing diguanylate cyclase [Crocosphaera sp.]CCQ55616.1 Putative diguanylate cyclase/phosphodiesterase (GGDEF & EAL domains) with Response Regulator Receiver modulation [Crocosphaera watsonii WH 